MSKTTDQIIRDGLINSLKKDFQKADWWKEVQEDVKTGLMQIIGKIDTMGSSYCQTFMTLFKWEFERRKAEGKTVTNPMAGMLVSLLGMRIPEEAYQCGILPTRAVLNLYDYIEPNDSDVAACMFLCNKIEMLEKAKMIPATSEQKTTKEDIAAAFKDVSTQEKKLSQFLKQKGPTKSDITEENFEWDDEEEGDKE